MFNPDQLDEACVTDEYAYLSALYQVYHDGSDRPCRNGVRRGLFDLSMKFDMSRGFPAITTRRLAWRSTVAELLGFIRGYSNEKQFADLECHWWKANADAWKGPPSYSEPGALGRTYGIQWRHWRTVYWVGSVPLFKRIDQIANLVEGLKADPYSTRHYVSAWNPGELELTCLPPCHVAFQCYADPVHRKLSLTMYQRSADMFLGVPANIASYSLLLHILAKLMDYTPKALTIHIGDAHIYEAHLPQVKEQLTRDPYRSPHLQMNHDINSLGDLETWVTPDDFKLSNYRHCPAIKAEMIV